MKAPEIVKETIQAPHHFSDAEKLILGDQLTASMANQEQIDSEFESVKAEFKGRVSKAEVETGTLAQKFRDGFEMRPTVARVLFNEPSVGRKTYVRDETGEKIREEAMTYADQQRPLFSEEEPPAEGENGPGDEEEAKATPPGHGGNFSPEETAQMEGAHKKKRKA